MSAAVRVLQGKFGRVALLDMDRPLVTHAHSQCHVLIKVSGADTFFNVRERSYPLNDETAVLVNSWEPHAYAHHDPQAPRTVILALYVEPAWLAEIDGKLIASAHPAFFARSCVCLPPAIRDLSSALAMHMLCGDQIGAAQLDAQLGKLMMAVIDAFSEWRDLNVMPHAQDARIRRAIGFMRANVGIDLDMAGLAAEACLSRAHFFKLFQQCTNLTPSLYANALRVEAALAGLTHSRQSMVSLSGELGFSAQSHFTRFFQQHLGAGPTQYRKVVDVYLPEPMAAADAA